MTFTSSCSDLHYLATDITVLFFTLNCLQISSLVSVFDLRLIIFHGIPNVGDISIKQNASFASAQWHMHIHLELHVASVTDVTALGEHKQWQLSIKRNMRSQES